MMNRGQKMYSESPEVQDEIKEQGSQTFCQPKSKTNERTDCGLLHLAILFQRNTIRQKISKGLWMECITEGIHVIEGKH